jgi:hypothetical protein
MPRLLPQLSYFLSIFTFALLSPKPLIPKAYNQNGGDIIAQVATWL